MFQKKHLALVIVGVLLLLGMFIMHEVDHFRRVRALQLTHDGSQAYLAADRDAWQAAARYAFDRLAHQDVLLHQAGNVVTGDPQAFGLFPIGSLREGIVFIPANPDTPYALRITYAPDGTIRDLAFLDPKEAARSVAAQQSSPIPGLPPVLSADP